MSLGRPAALAAALALAPAAGGTAADGSATDAERYERLTYDHEVAAQCGLLSGAVRQAYRRQRDALAARSGLGPDALKRRRLAAIVAAMREYDNRGLGGHRAWCDGDGAAGTGRILSGFWLEKPTDAEKNP
jgi:hypothetical protein